MITISKSSYIRGLQCKKGLYLQLFHKELAIDPDEQDTKVFDIGNDVGKYAQELFPGGVDCGYLATNDKNASVELTKKYIDEGKEIIYEAAFEYDGLLCFADVLVRDGMEWIIYEVKSSTKVKSYHIDDASFQYYVISKNVRVKDVNVVCLNNKYIRQGEIDIKKLFVTKSVLKQALKLQDDIKQKSDEFKNITEMTTVPDIKIGKQCDEPYSCNFKGYCWKDIPEYSVFNIQNMHGKEFELYNMGVVNLKDIPEDFVLNEKQQLEVTSYLNNTDSINRELIKDFVDQLSYPMYFLDFETYAFAIPEFDNSRSYQAIPFQYSLYYKETKDSEPEAYPFLAETFEDPRKIFAESLIKMTDKPGMIIVYNAGFEKSRINELIRDFPEYKDPLNKINERILDLMVPFRKKAYYKPAMRSSYSMKDVLPAINPKYSYSNLNVKEGMEAGSEFLKMRNITNANEIEIIRKNLIDYCNRDTFGMIVILEDLEKMCASFLLSK